MSGLLSAQLIIQMAIDIERNGTAFYRNLANSAQSAEVRGIFSRLAAAEKQHVVDFLNIMELAPTDNIAESYAGEVADYLAAVSREHIFIRDHKRYAELQFADDDQALAAAISLEKDSILLYYDLLNHVEGSDKEVVRGLIDEEKAHLVLLSEVRSTLK